MSLQNSVEQAYGIRIDQFERYKDVYRMNTRNHRLLCLKPFSVAEEDVRFIASVMMHLRRAGFRASPRIRQTRTNSLWTTIGSQRYIVTNWVPGRTPLFGRYRELVQGVQTLARFHTYAHHLSLSSVPSSRIRTKALAELPAEAKTLISQHVPLQHSARLLAQCNLANALFQARDVQIAMSREQRLRAFVHGDYNFPNLIRDTSGRMQLIDFDNTSLQPRMEDFSHLIHRNAPWNGEKTMRLIETYDHVRPLTQRDFRLLLALLSVPYPLVRAIHQHNRLGAGQVRRATPEAAKVKRFLQWIERRFAE